MRFIHKTVVALLVLVPLVILPGTYLRTALERKRGRLGLIAPVVVAGAIALAWFVPGALGLTGPDVWLDGQFLTNAHSNTPENAGLYPAIIGSVAIVTLVAIISFVFGVGAAVFLEDYTSDEGFTGSIVITGIKNRPQNFLRVFAALAPESLTNGNRAVG
jgi:phosphate transport system permease protein